MNGSNCQPKPETEIPPIVASQFSIQIQMQRRGMEGMEAWRNGTEGLLPWLNNQLERGKSGLGWLSLLEQSLLAWLVCIKGFILWTS